MDLGWCFAFDFGVYLVVVFLLVSWFLILLHCVLTAGFVVCFMFVDLGLYFDWWVLDFSGFVCFDLLLLRVFVGFAGLVLGVLMVVCLVGSGVGCCWFGYFDLFGLALDFWLAGLFYLGLVWCFGGLCWLYFVVGLVLVVLLLLFCWLVWRRLFVVGWIFAFGCYVLL